jgi:hypothetical protein
VAKTHPTNQPNLKTNPTNQPNHPTNNNKSVKKKKKKNNNKLRSQSVQQLFIETRATMASFFHTLRISGCRNDCSSHPHACTDHGDWSALRNCLLVLVLSLASSLEAKKSQPSCIVA